MPNETRNQLIYIDILMNKETEEERNNYFIMLLERYFYQLQDQIEETERQKAELLQNMELLKSIVKNNNLKSFTLDKIK